VKKSVAPWYGANEFDLREDDPLQCDKFPRTVENSPSLRVPRLHSTRGLDIALFATVDAYSRSGAD
jgi:hypothetical protein